MKNITTLVHHIKLNESGWWEKAVQNIIISSIGAAGNYPQTKGKILSNIISELEQGIDKSRLTKQFDHLYFQKQIINPSGELFVLSEEEFESYNSNKKELDEVENNARQRFIDLTQFHCKNINPEDLWEDFKVKMLHPLIKDIGAKTYEFVSGQKSINISEQDSFQNFAKCYDEDSTEVEKVVVSYMQITDVYTKKFLLKLLNEYFFIEATNLDEQTVNEIYKLSKTQQNLKVFVDTNFLLTILDLHDNPSNEATNALLELLDEIKNKVKIKFYILPNTISEFQNLILKFQDYITRIKPTIEYAKAVEESTEFSGIIKKYFQKCNDVQRIIPPAEYFEPFLSNFSVYYRSKGLELHNQNVDNYSTDQRVVDDLVVQTDYRLKRTLEKNGNGKKLSEPEIDLIKNRIYDKFNHDCQIWHIVKDRRPKYIDSPKDVINWIITLDFSFLEYDKYKQKVDVSQKVGICIHPNELISMLQFWVPRTEKFEKAILGNFCMPFLFKDIESDSEKISIAILSSLSQFEGHQTYSKELVAEILTNRALRQKIKPSNTIEENAELIKAEVLKKFEEAQKALVQEKKTSENLETELGQVSTKLEKMSIKLEEISKTFIEDTEALLKRKQNDIIVATDKERKQLLEKIGLISDRLKDLNELKLKAELEVKERINSFSGRIIGLFTNQAKYHEKLKTEIIPKFFDNSKYQELIIKKELLNEELESLQLSQIQDKIIVFCENKNSGILNTLEFKNVVFIPERNSNGVFIKVRANPEKFGLRDRDFLTDSEIMKLQQEYPNYFILSYYCFENYLFHPNNISEFGLKNFNVNEYKSEIINQKNAKKEAIISIYKKSRDSYEEFKIDSEKMKSKNDEHIIEYLKSDNIEIFYKAFSMKDYFDKTILEKYNLSPSDLASTNWFKSEFSKIIRTNK